MTLFDTIGGTYNKTRVADERIIDALVRQLDLPGDAIIADIGAGSGNYSLALAARGYHIKAVEPAETMRRQAVPSPRIEWFPGIAEQIPLADASVDGVISTLAIHHFNDLGRAFAEMARIAPRCPIVIFTFDPRAGQKTWIADYFPSIWNDAFRIFPPIHDVAGLLEKTAGCTVDVVPFHLPHDLKDNFAAAGWRTPHRYLDAAYRENISSFRIVDQDAVSRDAARLAKDLEDGIWQQRYGDTLLCDAIDAGYRFLKVQPAL